MYDDEQVIRDIETLMKAQLNTEIACINTQKNDALILATIPSDHYVFETLDSRVNNFKNFFILYGLVNNEAVTAQADNFVEPVTVTVQAATFDCGEKTRSNTIYKLLRYRNAIKNVLLKNTDVFQGYSIPLIKGLKPEGLPFDNKRVILTCGIDVTASITAN